jgi:hypothetical protein
LKNKRKGDWIKGKNEHMDVFGFLKLISLNLNTYFYHINLKEAKEFLNPAFNNTFFHRFWQPMVVLLIPE